MARIAVETCERLINNAASQCPVAPAPAPNLDALAIAISTQSSAISSQATYLTLGSIIFAVIAIIAALGWGWVVKNWAQQAARDAVKDWMDKNAPSEIAKLVGDLVPPQVDGRSGGSAMTQTEQERALGEDDAENTG